MVAGILSAGSALSLACAGAGLWAGAEGVRVCATPLLSVPLGGMAFSSDGSLGVVGQERGQFQVLAYTFLRCKSISESIIWLP